MINGELTNIYATDLCNEVQAIVIKIAHNSTPLNVLNYICSCTVPVVSKEGSFSKLNVIKPHLHSSITQERLAGLETL